LKCANLKKPTKKLPMNKELYTSNGEHPEDAVYSVKKFIKELQNVQESYFNKLSKSLNLTEAGDDHLFDYIYNDDDSEVFQHYLEKMGTEYQNVCKNEFSNSN
jgi:hypothetical protein